MSGKRTWGSVKEKRGFETFMEMRIEAFAASFAKFMQQAPHDFSNEAVNQVVNGFPIEALHDWERDHKPKHTQLLVWEVFLDQKTREVSHARSLSFTPTEDRERVEDYTTEWHVRVHAPNIATAIARATQLVDDPPQRPSTTRGTDHG